MIKVRRSKVLLPYSLRNIYSYWLQENVLYVFDIRIYPYFIFPRIIISTRLKIEVNIFQVSIYNFYPENEIYRNIIIKYLLNNNFTINFTLIT